MQCLVKEDDAGVVVIPHHHSALTDTVMDIRLGGMTILRQEVALGAGSLGDASLADGGLMKEAFANLAVLHSSLAVSRHSSFVVSRHSFSSFPLFYD